MTEPILPSVTKAIDKLYWTPSERASGVHSLLQEMLSHIRKKNKSNGEPEDKDVPSDWDILCFAIEFTGVQAITLQDEEFLELAVEQGRWLYSAHYSNPGRLYGEPDREEEEQKKGDQK